MKRDTQISSLKVISIASSVILLVEGLKGNNSIEILATVTAIVATVILFRLEHRKEQISDLKERADKYAHLRGIRANYFNSPLKSTSTFLQVIVGAMEEDEIRSLMRENYFDSAEIDILFRYFENIPQTENG